MQTRAEAISPNRSAALISARSRRPARAAPRTSALRSIWLRRPWTDRGPCGIKNPCRKRPPTYRCCEDGPTSVRDAARLHWEDLLGFALHAAAASAAQLYHSGLLGRDDRDRDRADRAHAGGRRRRDRDGYRPRRPVRAGRGGSLVSSATGVGSAW